MNGMAAGEAPIRGATDRLSVGQCATLACILEAAAPKPGNVHPAAEFDDMSFPDLVISAVAIGPVMDRAVQRGVGATVLDAARATRRAVGINTNLGTVLLLAPLAAVPHDEPLDRGVGRVLASLTPEDTRAVYEAIRIAEPGGLGEVEAMDVAHPPPTDLLAAMAAAAERDMVARQYAEGFRQVLGFVVPALAAGIESGWPVTEAIVHTHLELMARFPDSLIARKCGAAVAREASERAAAVLEAGLPGDGEYRCAVRRFDAWLRSDGHRRNPGTTADLIAAGLFAGLRDGRIQPPFG